jgi:hypothetical protein
LLDDEEFNKHSTATPTSTEIGMGKLCLNFSKEKVLG